jgi:hypothetical protein
MTDTNDVQMLDATGSDDKNDEVKELNVGPNVDLATCWAMLTTLLGLRCEGGRDHDAFSEVGANDFYHHVDADKVKA